MMMKQVVRAVAAAAVLLTGMSAQADLVRYRLTGVVTESGVFDDGTMVPVATPVSITYSYETKQPSSEMQRNDDGSGMAAYEFLRPYHFKLRVGDHRARVDAFRVTLNNDLNQPFGDTYDLEAVGGVYIDHVLQPDATFTVSLLSQFGNVDALRSLKLPKHLNEWAFDAFRSARLAAAGDRTLLMIRIDRIKSTVCAQTAPGTDDCAE
ncbi:MAG TPA: hypothetical protein VFY73_23770 [Ideonella sp.]|uniref:hypothetical protein n=1 Tax=Ideonella sp. TaxID=1929293 RepID=UPI002E368AF2|nr:hypothetical protein [Ideonella sp.]HEX5687043.1 hypothetical protein [Ideonella sp.]